MFTDEKLCMFLCLCVGMCMCVYARVCGSDDMFFFEISQKQHKVASF